MVNIYYGRAGTGKTHALENEARRLLKKGMRVFFVVPEQLTISREYSFNETELQGVQVQSFSRLSNTVFRLLGGTAKKLPDSAMNTAALYRAVKEVYQSLSCYKSTALSHGFISKLSSAFAEFDTCRISLESIEAIPQDSIPPSTLLKYRDMFLIYRRFKLLWEGEYKAPGDDITLAAAMLESNDIFNDAVFMFDGFYGFTAQQLELISQLMSQASGCFFAFTTDLESELFQTVSKEVRRIETMCKRQDIPCTHIKTDGVQRRLTAPVLRFIESSAAQAPTLTHPNEKYANDPGLTVYCAKNSGEELNFIACKIKNDVLNGKYRYRDIAVLSPDSESLSPLAAAVFAKHGVPAFTDIKKSLLSMPLTAMVLSAAEAACDGLNYENVFSFLKTGLAGLSFDDISILENYVRMWKIKGGGWLREKWTQSPSGISSGIRDCADDDSRLLHINELKNKATAPLIRFSENIKKAHGCEDMLRAVCGLFDDLNVSDALLSRARYFESTGELHLSDEYTRIYEIFIQMLDSINEIFGNMKISPDEFYDILSVCAGSVTVSSRPACTDEIIFSGLGRVRTDNVKCIYICRMNDGFIPKAPSDNDLITDADKRLFAKYGITTSMDFLQSAAREKFDFYSALTSASKELVLSYSTFEITGEELLKSEFLESIQRLTGTEELIYEKLPPEFHLVSIAGASDLAARLKNPRLTKEVYKAGGILQIQKTENDRLSDDIVYGLYSKNLRLSFSGIEEFIGCPFKFFIDRGLKARKNETVEMNPANIGTFIHHGLERLLSGEFDLEGDISAHIDTISEDYKNSVLKDCTGSSKRWDKLFLRAKGALSGAANSVVKEIHGSDYKPFDFEIDISRYTPPAQLPDGCTLTLVGSIDRVDILECQDERFAKIIDYKSGSQDFSLKKIYNGLSMQLPIYAGAVKSRFPDIKIAAMYYLKVGVPDINLTDKNGIDSEQYLEKTEQYYKRDGIFSAKAAAGTRLGDGIKTLGKIRKERLVSDSELDRLIDFTRRKIYDTGVLVMSGNVTVSPIDDNSVSACAYCDYGDICKVSRNPECRRKLEPLPDGFLEKEDLRS